MEQRNTRKGDINDSFPPPLRASLQRGRATLASGLTLAGGQKMARVYKQTFIDSVTLQPGTTNARLLKGSGNK